MSTQAEFQLRREALHEAKRLATHPREELVRLEHEAADGDKAASLLIVVAGVFLAVWAIAAILYGFVVLIAQLAA